jgi:hypothetical protein
VFILELGAAIHIQTNNLSIRDGITRQVCQGCRECTDRFVDDLLAADQSAAAPHVAAIAALVLQAAPCLLSTSTVNAPATARANLRNFITSTAVPLPGVSQRVPNNIEGFGLVDALAAVQTTLSLLQGKIFRRTLLAYPQGIMGPTA